MKRYTSFLFLFLISLFFYTASAQILNTLYTKKDNSVCNGRGCTYSGPSIVINEFQPTPANDVIDGSIYDDTTRLGAYHSMRGEWIELYNPDNCRWVDISNYFLGNCWYDYIYVRYLPACFQLPNNVLVPPQGFVIIRGTRAPAVPSNLLLKNGGKTIEIVVDNKSYINLVDFRLWLPNLGGWIGLYNQMGEPMDAISWGDLTSAHFAGKPITPSVNGNLYNGELASYNDIPESRKKKVISFSPQVGKTYCRIPDGGEWAVDKHFNSTYGTCNEFCPSYNYKKCNGSAEIFITKGTPPFTYQWDDSAKSITSKVNNLCPGLYHVTITDATGAKTIQDVRINQILPPLNLGRDTNFCSSFNYTLSAGNPGSIYSWSTGETTQTVKVSSMGFYSVKVSTPDNCYLFDTILVTKSTKPNLGNDTTICPYSYIKINAGMGYQTYNWSDGSNTREIIPKSAGRYIVTATDKYNCSLKDTINISFYPSTRIFLGNDTSYCKSRYMLSLAPGFNYYKWSDGSIGQSIVPKTSGTYWVEIKDKYNCKQRDSINITINPFPDFDLGPDKTICEGDSVIADVGSNFTSYAWSNGNKERAIYLKTPDKYFVTVTNQYNCSITDSISLYFYPKTEIVQIDTSINGQLIIYSNTVNLPHLYAIDQKDYQYDNIFNRLEPGTHSISIKDNNNCILSAQVKMYRDIIIIPNYFTPNGDGFHDTWEIKGISSYPNAKIQIYDRFGKLLATYSGKDIGWDGTSGSILQKSDDYWYSVDLQDGTKPFIGNVSLKR